MTKGPHDHHFISVKKTKTAAAKLNFKTSSKLQSRQNRPILIWLVLLSASSAGFIILVMTHLLVTPIITTDEPSIFREPFSIVTPVDYYLKCLHWKGVVVEDWFVWGENYVEQSWVESLNSLYLFCNPLISVMFSSLSLLTRLFEKESVLNDDSFLWWLS